MKKRKLTPPSQVANDFREWISRMGFKGAKVSQAAQALGFQSHITPSALSTGKRELTLTERLAMSAIRAGLQPWTPEYDDVLVAEHKATSAPTAE